jgi:ketosteroid isomerase-like protein
MAADRLAIIKAYLDHWFAHDVDAMEPLLTDDLVLWHNHIDKEFNKAEMLGFVRGSLDVIEKIEFRNQRWTVIGDAILLLQHEMYVRMRDGRILQDVPNAIVYTMRDGRIARIDEYVDGPAFAPLGLG